MLGRNKFQRATQSMSDNLEAQVTRRQFLQMVVGGTVAAGILTAGGVGLAAVTGPYSLVVERVQIALRNLPSAAEGMRIVQLSDFHLYPFTKLPHIERAIVLANSLEPDVIVLTGDYVLESAEAIFDLAPTLAQLNPRTAFLAAMGNHDYWTNATVIAQGFAEQGIRLLQNEHVTLPNGVVIAGLDDPWSGMPDLAATLEGIQAEQPVVLLAHEPDFFDLFATDPRLDLMLSGHTHGGQVNLPIFGAPYLPRYGRKYVRGHHLLGAAQLYVNRGIGTTGGNFRLDAAPEVTEITLVRL